MKKFLLIVCIICIVIFIIHTITNIIIKKIYPKDYSEYVEKYSKEYNVDSNLVYAIIKAESNFNKNVISKSGANRSNANNGRNSKRSCK